MSITDELRVFAKRWPYTDYIHKDILAIADRIDAEHERAMADAYLSGMPTDEKLTELGCIRLPKDADEVPWNVGERDEDGNVVTQLRLTSAGWFIITNGNWPYRPKHKRHRHAPTVEDVLCDLLNEYHENGCTLEEVRLSEYAAKLRLAEGEDA